jgi:hypothetical protein
LVALTGNNQMADAVVEALVLDLLTWLESRDRTYEEAIDAWRTSCPKLPVWEDATDRGLIAREYVGGLELMKVTSQGRELLEKSRPSSIISMPTA